MKNIIYSLILMFGLLVSMAIGNEVMAGHPELVSGPPQNVLVTNSATTPSTKASVAGDVQIAFEQTNDGTEGSGNFFLDNWGKLLVGLLTFCDVVARLTPTTKDNSIVNLLVTIVNAIIPNFKKGGGVF